MSASNDEFRFLELLDAYHAATEPAVRRQLEQQILLLVDKHFREALLPWMVKTFGKQVVNRKEDGAARLTAMLNEFYAKVLEKRHDEFWRARTLKDLGYWAGVVMRNNMLTYFRTHTRRRKILAEHAEEIEDMLAPLFEQRRTHFETQYPDLAYERVVAQIAAWEASDDKRLLAAVIQMRYIDGMPYDDIAATLQSTVSEVYRVRDRAIARLRKLFE